MDSRREYSSEAHGIANRGVQRVKEGRATAMVQSGFPEER